jgi:hypothetical protein
VSVIHKAPVFRTVFSWVTPGILAYRILAVVVLIMAFLHRDENPVGLSILVVLCLLFLSAIPFQSIVVYEGNLRVANYYGLGIIPIIYTEKISNIRYFGHKGYEADYMADDTPDLAKYFEIENKSRRLEIITKSGKTKTWNMNSIIESEFNRAILAVHTLKTKRN